ncbi:hypothetical protein PRUPE_6G176000 [Prunus persica]|uniref:Uncharacterized protein n=1 Tax=Prunus persica TaxID=3760 RepID=A0A251NRZ1_PRUPE|nr:hypothetical protein PRUPE_6G176000 [Prunus persica]
MDYGDTLEESLHVELRELIKFTKVLLKKE